MLGLALGIWPAPRVADDTQPRLRPAWIAALLGCAVRHPQAGYRQDAAGR
jgi:hypothetical protein